MIGWRGIIKKVLGEPRPLPESFVELSLFLPRLFILRPTSGSGLTFTQALDSLTEQAAASKNAESEWMRERILEEATKFSDAQREEFEEMLKSFSLSTEDFLNKLVHFVEVQDKRLAEIGQIRSSLETAQKADTLQETRQCLQKGMDGLQKMVETELIRHSELRNDREAYAARLEDKLETVQKESLTDILTGVANRAGCIKKMDGVLEFLRTNRAEYCLSIIDLNRFKQINDTLGHAAGDAALVAFSQRLDAAVGKSNFVGRLSGDEFIAISNGSPVTLMSMLTRLQDQLQVYPANYRGIALDISFSYGVTHFKRNATSAELLEEADKMLYRNKNKYYENLAA